MTKKFLTLTAALALCLSVAAQATFSFGTRTNPEGKTFEVDSKGFIVNGKHVLPVMGEIHFSRVPQRDWQREIQKMKAGGITVLATYIFWIHHEEYEGQWDWSGNRDLHRFLEICRAENMPVVLRVGPFCHGEVYQGGFPVWLTQKATADPKNYKLRTTAPGFMAATERLYSNIFAQVNGMLWKDGGPVVGVQIENECRGPWPYYMALKNMAVKIGFDTPFYTRTGWPKLNGKEEFGKMLPLYGDYADGFWDRNLSDMPGDYPSAFIFKDTRMSRVIATETFSANDLKEDGKTQNEAADATLSYPYLTCELGGGMATSYHRRINMSGNEPLPLAICKVGSGSNLPGYYMYHGGTNPYNAKHSMAECQASATTAHNDMPHMSYEFQAPLGEMGQPNFTAYHQTRWFHQFLADWGEELSQMDVDSLSEHYARRGNFVFRNDYVRIIKEDGVASVTPQNLTYKGLIINSATVQPFAKADDALYFITIKGQKPAITVNGKRYGMTLDKPRVIAGTSFIVLSPEKAKTAFAIDGKMLYAKHGGILYKNSAGIVCEEYWEYGNESISPTLTKEAGAPRTVAMGAQKVAEQPSEADFDNAAVYSLDIPAMQDNDDAFLEISYKGDCARVYADGRLVQDNFWNGKAMMVRISDLVGKKVELRILPLTKDAPIYLQKAQREVLNKATGNTLLSLDGIKVMHRTTTKPKISIFGDSYSTYEGYLTPDTNAIWYFRPESKYLNKGNDVRHVEETWWHQAINRMGGVLERNNAFSGSTVCYTGYKDKNGKHADYSDRAFVTRSNNLGNPDIILICAATNDSWAGAPIGEYKYEKQTKEDLYSFRPAMAKMLRDLKTNYPEARLVFMLNNELRQEINESVHTICKHYNVPCLDLRNIDKKLGHPSIKGMSQMADQVIEFFKK